MIDGTIDAVVSDHTLAPTMQSELFGEAAPGATGLNAAIAGAALCRNCGRTVAGGPGWITHRAAEAAKLSAGRIAVDHVADLCVFRSGRVPTDHRAGLRSAGKNSPFIGYELPGVVRATVAGGHIGYEATA